MSSWINTVNTTSFRIVISTICTGIGMLLILVATLFFNWQPTEVQVKVLGGLGIAALTIMGFDVTQFIGKRFSDAGYAAAKVTPVNVESASVVTAGAPLPGQQPTARSAAEVTVPVVAALPHREPEHGDDP